MKTIRRSAGLFLFVLVLAALYGCPKSADVSSTPEQKVEIAPAATTSEAAKAAEAQKNAEAAAATEAARRAEEERAAKAETGMKAVYFDYDRAIVRDDARAVLKANAAYLKANPNVKVRIEGNCDERGTVEYNQALGQRRAANTKKYLSNLGISSQRISLISYGKEKPFCQESSEDCWQKNRRADLVPLPE